MSDLYKGIVLGTLAVALGCLLGFLLFRKTTILLAPVPEDPKNPFPDTSNPLG